MLSYRLNRIIAAVPQCNSLADVGCDHGFVGIQALTRGIAKQVVFADVSAESLAKARQNIPQELMPCASFICQDGLGSLQCDCAVIAGMGGREIIFVLRNAEFLPQYLVLQPMKNQPDLRKYLAEEYHVATDEKFFDGKYYDLILAIKGKGEALTDLQLLFGKTNLQRPSEDFRRFLAEEENKYTQILQRCNSSDVANKLHYVRRASLIIQEVQS